MGGVVVLLVGHGVPPSDYPRERLAEYMRLKTLAEAGDRRAGEQYGRLEREMRRWPRTKENDPYWAGVMELAREIKRAGGFASVKVAFNEFCAPDLEEAFEEVSKLDIDTVVVVPTMIVRGGEHSETEIKEKIDAAKKRHPRLNILYAWPFDLAMQAEFFAAHVNRFIL